jgi:hypothetical protein
MKKYVMVAGEKGSGLKLVTWMLAYAVWIFIFLIPVIGIIIIMTYLMKNRSQQGGAVVIDRSEAHYKKLNPG